MECIDIQFIILLIILYIISAIVNSIFFGWMELKADFALAEIIALLGIAALFIVSWFDRRAVIARNKKIACHSIIIEIDEMERGFKNGGYEKIEYGDISYTNAFFSIDAYDSLIQSGNFMELKKDTQNRIKNFYISAKLRNEAIHELGKYYDEFFVDSPTPDRKERWNKDERRRYEYPITVYEKYILDNFDNIRKTMSDELLGTKRWIF